MRPIKLKVPLTKEGEVHTISDYAGSAFHLQAVFYTSNDPSKHLYIYDADNDIIAHPIPGQMEAKLMELPPIDCKLPLKILDEAGGNAVIIYGLAYKPSLTA